MNTQKSRKESNIAGRDMFTKKFKAFALTSIIALSSTLISPSTEAAIQTFPAQTQQIAIPTDGGSAKVVKTPYTIIWDLNGVLLNVSRFGMAKAIGLWDLIAYSILERKNLKKVVFNFLEQEFGTQDPEIDSPPATGDNVVLPQIMCDWLAGLNGPEIIETACALADTTDHLGSDRERRAAKKCIRAIFNPDIIGEHTHPIQGGTDLLAECAETCNEDESLRNKMMILSNYAADAYDSVLAKEESNSIFKHVLPENRIISGYVDLIKPYASIYTHMVLEHGLDPNYCIFIDDQLENILEARKCGIIALHFTGDYDKLRQELQDLGAL